MGLGYVRIKLDPARSLFESFLASFFEVRSKARASFIVWSELLPVNIEN